MIRHGVAPYLEYSSRGDARYSAFSARIKNRGNDSIEEIYQAAKVFSDGSTGLSWRQAKGREPVNIAECSALYSRLWDEYVEENPDLAKILFGYAGLADMFGQPGHACQATELWRIRNTFMGRYPYNLDTTIVDRARKAVFVFGSNLLGIHGAGAARDAARLYGAVRGVGEGVTGNAYALPTKLEPYKPMGLTQITDHVAKFLEFAAANPALDFKVVRVGCGLAKVIGKDQAPAGFSDDEIAPLFNAAPANCMLPGTWEARRHPGLARIIVAGARTACMRASDEDASHSRTGKIRQVLDQGQFEIAHQKLNTITAGIFASLHDVSVICGGADGGDLVGNEWAARRNVKIIGFPAEWKRYGNAAGFIRNAEMAWYGTHMIALTDGATPGTSHMIDCAAKGKMPYRTIDVGAFPARLPGSEEQIVPAGAPGQ